MNLKEKVAAIIYPQVATASISPKISKVIRIVRKNPPIKLHAVNVVELQTDEGVILGIRSFATTPKGIKTAEKLFAKLIKENYPEATQEDIDASLDNGFFEEGTYKVIIEWS